MLKGTAKSINVPFNIEVKPKKLIMILKLSPLIN
jgi:hypothetical protein